MSARPVQAFRLSGFTPRRAILVLVAFMVGLALPSTGGRLIAVVGPAAAAADPAAGAWLAEEVRGTVLIRAAGEAPASWQPLQAATPIAGQSEIATGSDGVAVLDNGVDQIRLTPNSRLVLPADESAGLMTVIRQSLGKIFFDIGPRPDRRFEVDAPYLVVLVKGTQFTVSANYLGDSVAVTEGTVEVHASAGGDSPGTLIGAGQTASVGAGGSSIGVESSGPSSGDGSGQGMGKGEPQSNLPPARKAKPPGGGGGGEDGEGSGDGDGEGGEQSGGGNPDPGEGGDPGDGEGGGPGCPHGHGGESGD
jgi:FecR protein